MATDVGFTSMVPGYNGLEVFDNELAVTGLAPGTEYFYKLKSKNGAILSSYSSYAIILETTTASAATGITSTSFFANWSSVLDATEYFLDVSTVSNFASFVSGFNNLNVGNVLTYEVTGLTANTQYFYRVRAGN
jgi:phosphodiesterase/alkaline phosphatase D-like protein